VSDNYIYIRPVTEENGRAIAYAFDGIGRNTTDWYAERLRANTRSSDGRFRWNYDGSYDVEELRNALRGVPDIEFDIQPYGNDSHDDDSWEKTTPAVPPAPIHDYLASPVNYGDMAPEQIQEFCGVITEKMGHIDTLGYVTPKEGDFVRCLETSSSWARTHKGISFAEAYKLKRDPNEYTYIGYGKVTDVRTSDNNYKFIVGNGFGGHFAEVLDIETLLPIKADPALVIEATKELMVFCHGCNYTDLDDIFLEMGVLNAT